jgi:hypothetical protein
MNAMNENVVRRDFIKQLSAAGVAALMARAPRLLADEKVEQPVPTADSCILLWMAGGMAAPDSLDPKRYKAFEPGTPVKDVLSTFPSIDTAVDDIKICKGLENIAGVMTARR